jgi:hypothetical protein
MVETIIEKWKLHLGLTDWIIITEQIVDTDSIDYNDQYYFIGIERDFNNKVGIIYHDIPLREIDICHELLHIRYPETLFPYLNYNQYEEWIDRKSYKLLENEKV